jgi:hypothetical protein
MERIWRAIALIVRKIDPKGTEKGPRNNPEAFSRNLWLKVGLFAVHALVPALFKKPAQIEAL